MNYRFEVEQDKHGNWTALGYKDESLIETITCVSKHSHAVSAGLRWKKRMLERVFDKKSKVIKFGKFNGKTTEYVLINEPSYIMWMQSNKVADISAEPVERPSPGSHRPLCRRSAETRLSEMQESDVPWIAQPFLSGGNGQMQLLRAHVVRPG